MSRPSSKRKRKIKIGTVLFTAVLIYLVTALVQYMTKSHVSPYELTEGTIVEDSVYTGVIIRNEKEVKAKRSGYVNYYLEDNSKAGAGQSVCALSGKELKVPESSGQVTVKELSSAQESVMLSGIQHYVSSYSPDHYSALYDLHNDINTAYGVNSSDYIADQIDAMVKKGADIDFVQSPSDGLIVYTVDSLDGLQEKDVNSKLFENKNYQERVIRQNAKIKKGDSVFKVISDETWSILFPLTKENAEKMKDATVMETRVGNMQSTIWADVSVTKIDGDPFAKLTYKTDMLQFASQRFVSVELILQNDSGLKVPRSALVKRNVYEIPSDFVITDPNTSAIGVRVEDDAGDISFHEIELFCKLDADSKGQQFCYVKPGQIEEGSILHKENSTKTYIVTKKVKMDGVYNINKGYASFQYVNVIASNKMYYIIEANSPYGPSTYDHVALNADQLGENRVIH